MSQRLYDSPDWKEFYRKAAGHIEWETSFKEVNAELDAARFPDDYAKAHELFRSLEEGLREKPPEDTFDHLYRHQRLYDLRKQKTDAWSSSAVEVLVSMAEGSASKNNLRELTQIEQWGMGGLVSEDVVKSVEEMKKKFQNLRLKRTIAEEALKTARDFLTEENFQAALEHARKARDHFQRFVGSEQELVDSSMLMKEAQVALSYLTKIQDALDHLDHSLLEKLLQEAGTHKLEGSTLVGKAREALRQYKALAQKYKDSEAFEKDGNFTEALNLMKEVLEKALANGYKDISGHPIRFLSRRISSLELRSNLDLVDRHISLIDLKKAKTFQEIAESLNANLAGDANKAMIARSGLTLGRAEEFMKYYNEYTLYQPSAFSNPAAEDALKGMERLVGSLPDAYTEKLKEVKNSPITLATTLANQAFWDGNYDNSLIRYIRNELGVENESLRKKPVLSLEEKGKYERNTYLLAKSNKNLTRWLGNSYLAAGTFDGDAAAKYPDFVIDYKNLPPYVPEYRPKTPFETDEPIDPKQLERRGDGLHYQRGKRIPFSGSTLTHHPGNNRKQELKTFRYGKFHGVHREWHYNGNVLKETGWEEGLLHGYSIQREPFGKVTKQKFYHKGKLVPEMSGQP